jgi:hypothetical protein
LPQISLIDADQEELAANFANAHASRLSTAKNAESAEKEPFTLREFDQLKCFG